MVLSSTLSGSSQTLWERGRDLGTLHPKEMFPSKPFLQGLQDSVLSEPEGMRLLKKHDLNKAWHTHIKLTQLWYYPYACTGHMHRWNARAESRNIPPSLSQKFSLTDTHLQMNTVLSKEIWVENQTIFAFRPQAQELMAKEKEFNIIFAIFVVVVS